MKTLVIAEKPDMGRNIAAAIEPKAKNYRTYLEGDNYIVTWAIGHLVGLAEPDAYDDRYKKWNIEHLPIVPDQFKLVANPRTKDQLKVIGELAKRCGDIVNGCDAGREGQYIFALIQRYLKLRHPVKRLWISDLTAETIRRGFAELRDGAEYNNLTKAASARSEADWLIGMNGSRAFTTKHNVLLSVGRVQTPVLALVYDRQMQIETFKSHTYYELAAQFAQHDMTYKGMWQGDKETGRETLETIAQKVKGKPAVIASYEVKDAKEYPGKLYDLTLLQREANGKYGFSAKKTLDTAQALYEKHKVITYPRTNSNYVTEQNIPDMHKALSALQGTEYDAWVQGADRRFVHKGNKFVCNPAKVEDHHAILPTPRKAAGLSPDEKKLYDLIVRRFLAIFYPPAEYKSHTVLTETEGELFKTSVKELVSEGWKAIYSDLPGGKEKKGGGRKSKDDDAEPEEEVSEPFAVDPAMEALCRDATVKEKETKPPKPYTEGTLLKAMESAGKQIEDEDVRDAMKDSGLGTPATRAATIERLKTVGYIAMKGKQIAITGKGRAAIQLIRDAGVDLLTSPEMTGMWEKRLNEIARGTASDVQFMDNVKKFANMIVEKVRRQQRASMELFQGEESAGKRGSRGGSTRTRSSASGGQGKPRAGRKAASGAAAAPSAAAASPAAPQPVIIGTCPRAGCGGTVFLGRKGYGCSNYKSGCRFVIWKESMGRRLTDAQVRALVEKGKTAKLKLADKDGAEQQGRIVLADRNTGELAIEV